MPSAAAKQQSDVTFDRVKPDDLRFDPANPRFATGGSGLSQPAIQALLEKEPHLALELVPSFLENGFIDYEPLVVRSSGKHYRVVEGNRRLAAIKHILSKEAEFAKTSSKIDDLKSIPVLIFPDAPEAQGAQEQRVYLGVRHLFGFREWPPESKARYLDAHIKTGEDLQRLTRELNIKRQDIQRYLVPFRLRKAAAQLWQDHRDQDFWVLGEGLNRTGIKTYIALDVEQATLKVRGFDQKKLGNLLTFIYGTPSKNRADRVVKETRQLSSLAKLLQDVQATAALEKGASLARASVLIESDDESRKRLRSLLQECRAVIERFGHGSNTTEMRSAFKAFADAAIAFLKNGS